MHAPPIASWIVSVHNGAEFLPQMIKSIEQQSIDDFEVVICDDNSSDETLSILKDYAARDKRVNLIQNKKNIGLAASLNRCIDESVGKFLVRLDGDDIAHRDRLLHQLRAFHADENLACLGSNVIQIDCKGNALGKTDLPLDDKDIRARSLFLNPFAHPSVMLCREILERYNLRYDPRFLTTQDWDFWVRLMPFGNVKNLATPLVWHRVHSESISAQKKELQAQNSTKIQKRHVENILSYKLSDHDTALIQFGFLGSVQQNRLNGINRVEAIHKVLDIYIKISDKKPEIINFKFKKWLFLKSFMALIYHPIDKKTIRLLFRLLFHWCRFTR